MHSDEIIENIVTYDNRHLLKIKEFEGIRLVSSTEFLRIYRFYF